MVSATGLDEVRGIPWHRNRCTVGTRQSPGVVGVVTGDVPPVRDRKTGLTTTVGSRRGLHVVRGVTC